MKQQLSDGKIGGSSPLGVTMAGKSQRFLWADVIRIIAIYLVVAVHLSYIPKYISSDNLFYYIHFAIAKTSIPLFVMLSGALLLTKYESYKDFYLKRVRRVIFPWIFWSFVYIFFLGLPLSFGSFKTSLQAFWFMPMVMGLYILTPAIRKITVGSSKKDVGIIILLWFIAVSIFPFYHNSPAFPFSPDSGLVRQIISFVGYYLLGFYIFRFISDTKKNIFMAIVFMLVGLLTVILSFLSKSGIAQESLYYFDYISPGIVLLSTGLFVIICAISNRFGSFLLQYRNVISSIAAASFGIYFIHSIVWKYLQEFAFMKNNPAQNMLVSVFVVFFLSSLLIVFCRKIPIMGKIIS